MTSFYSKKDSGILPRQRIYRGARDFLGVEKKKGHNWFDFYILSLRRT